jgi:hypothetical protein
MNRALDAHVKGPESFAPEKMTSTLEKEAASSVHFCHIGRVQ